eukprot:6672049-Pyramimonas_sp.AAC.1
MTFASRLRTLREDAAVFRKYCETPGRPADFELFCELCFRSGPKARRLVSSIPGFATHGETAWLAPLVPWEDIAKRSEAEPEAEPEAEAEAEADPEPDA